MGLAETYSKITRLPQHASLAPYASFFVRMSAITANFESVFRRKLIKPGPAIWTSLKRRVNSGSFFMVSTREAAISRGLRFKARAHCMATVQAKSPCERSLGFSTRTGTFVIPMVSSARVMNRTRFSFSIIVDKPKRDFVTRNCSKLRKIAVSVVSGVLSEKEQKAGPPGSGFSCGFP